MLNKAKEVYRMLCQSGIKPTVDLVCETSFVTLSKRMK